MSIVSRNRPPFGDDGEAIIFVGEVATVGFRLTDANGAVQSYAGRTFGLQVYLDGGTNKINVNGALTSHADGDYIQCALTEDETDLLTAGTLYGWGFVEYTADGPIVVCGGVVRAAAGATAAQASGSPGSGIGGITLYTLRIDTGIVTVTYMGAPGAGVLPGGDDGQFLVKDGASDYSTEWVTLGITHVSGLSATLSTLTSADVSLASRISTEEATRAAADTSLQTRLSTEEATRASADTSLTSRISTVETGYLPLTGGTMSGVLAFLVGTAALPGLAVAGDLNTGIYGVSADVLGVSAGGLNAASFSNGQLSLATAAGGAGVNLAVEAANALALRNGANAQAFRVYNTYTDASNYEQGGFYWSSNELRVGPERGGTGLSRSLVFIMDGTGRWAINTAASFVPLVDASYDIASAGLRVRDIHLSRRLLVGGTAPAGALNISAVSAIGSSFMMIGGDVLTDATSKRVRLGALHYLAAQAPIVALDLIATVSANTVNIGGGTGSGNAATEVAVWTAANNTTTTGTKRWSWDNSGHYVAAADATYNIGASASGRPNNVYAANAFAFNDNNYLNLSSTFINFRVNGGDRVAIGPSAQVQTRSDGAFSWSSTTSPTGTADLLLYRDGAGALALRNGAVAQALRIYNTWTDASNFERGSFEWSGNEFQIGTGRAGTGTARALVFRTNGSSRFYFHSTDGHFIPSADATYDIGSAALEVRDLHLSRRLHIGGTAPAGAANISAVQAFGQSFALIGGSVLTDATDKAMRIGGLHYLAAEEPVGALFTYAGTAASGVYIGGGTSSMNAATEVSIYTAANTTTVTGTQRWLWNSSGHYFAGADNTYDIGGPSANRPRNLYLAGTIATGGSITSGTSIVATTSITLGAANGINWTGRSVMRSPADGSWQLGNAAETSTVILAVDAANALALRNGANAQAFRVYNTTDGTNLERGAVQWALNELNIATEAAGTGSIRPISFSTGGTRRWFITGGGGHVFAAADNTYAIGAVGANRPSFVYVGTAFVNAAAGYYAFDGRSRIYSFSDGTLLLTNNAVNDFTRLNFGGATSAFPALRKQAGGIGIRLADDSAYAGLFASEVVGTSRVYAHSSTAIPAGGATGVGLYCTSAGGFGVFFGAGAPTINAAKGSLYLRSDGSGTSDRMYVNTDGGTGWTAVTTAT